MKPKFVKVPHVNIWVRQPKKLTKKGEKLVDEIVQEVAVNLARWRDKHDT